MALDMPFFLFNENKYVLDFVHAHSSVSSVTRMDWQ